LTAKVLKILLRLENHTTATAAFKSVFSISRSC